jgi:diguanylate cyclase (GGDEF)-like protein
VLWTLVAAVVGVGANRVMAEQRRQTALAGMRLDELHRLVETQNSIATTELGSDAVMESVVDEARRLTRADGAVVELPDGHELVYRAVSGRSAPQVAVGLPVESVLSGRALRDHETFICRDTETDDRADRDTCRRVGARSLLVVPLLHAGRAMGVLKVYSGTPDAFTDEHVQVVSLLAGMIGTALARADLLHKLSEQAVTDELTGLPNRRGWYDHLASVLDRARRTGAPVSIIALDVNGLKRVNDQSGHAAGDRLLREVTSRWSAALRESDVLGRLGGDEFGVVLDGVDATAASDVVARLTSCLRGEHSAAAGIATWDGTEDETSLLSRADEAMYRQKRTTVAIR